MTFIQKMSQEYDVNVIFDSFQGSEAFVMGKTIYLKPDLFPPRMNWLYCHELSHILLGHTDSGVISKKQETEADELASELILPENQFYPKAKKSDLSELKELFPHASWEVIARRRVHFRPAVLTILDNENLTSRGAPEDYNFPMRISEIEQSLINKTYLECQHFKKSADDLYLESYYIDENPDFKRVILLTEFTL